MLHIMLALFQVSQASPPPPPPPPPVKPMGAPVPLAPRNPDHPPVARTGDGTALGAIGAVDANQIEAAKLAVSKASSAEVRNFANLVLKAHQASLTSANNLSKQLKITRLLPADSAMARGHTEEMTELNLLTGTAFDKSFVQHAVDDHKAAIAKINNVLVPLAVRQAVKSYLKARLPSMVAQQQAGEKWLAAHP